MYTIIMNDDKQLVTTVRKTIYQRENMVDNIQFLFPEFYENINLSDCTAVLKYIDIGNELHSEILSKDSELYKGKVRFILPINTKLTRFAGNIIIRISITKINITTGISNEVLKTGECVISVLPDNTIIVSDDLTEKLATLESQIAELSNSQVDDLSLTNDLLQVTANGVTKGEGVKIIVSSVTDGEIDGKDDGILNLDAIDKSSNTEDTPTDDNNNDNSFVEL